MDQDIKDEINAYVRMGMFTQSELIEIFCEEMYEPGELVKDEVISLIESTKKQLQAQESNWPEITDCDRLDKAFAQMNEQGIIALQNAGYTQSDGLSDVGDLYCTDRKDAIGYCFYHLQDLERAVDNEGLMLTFGPVNAEDEQTKGPAIGSKIVKILNDLELKTDWDGSFNKRIEIPNVHWQRRLT